MASTDSRLSPLATWIGRFAEASAQPARFAIRELPFLVQFNVRGPMQGWAANTWNDAGLWLGPDEWLALGKAPVGNYRAVTETSASRTVIEISGEDARTVLAKGCTLDLAAA